MFQRLRYHLPKHWDLPTPGMQTLERSVNGITFRAEEAWHLEFPLYLAETSSYIVAHYEPLCADGVYSWFGEDLRVNLISLFPLKPREGSRHLDNVFEPGY